MRECHKCEHNGKGSEACIRCAETDNDALSNHGQCFVSIDAMENGEEFFSSRRASSVAHSSQDHQDDDRDERFRLFLFELFSLPDDHLLLVSHVFGGGSLSSFGQKRGISRQRVTQMVNWLLNRHPIFASTFSKRMNVYGGFSGRFHQNELAFTDRESENSKQT